MIYLADLELSSIHFLSQNSFSTWTFFYFFISFIPHFGTYSCLGLSPNQANHPSYPQAWVQPSFPPNQRPCPQSVKHDPRVGQYIVSPLKICDPRVKQCSACHKHITTQATGLIVVSKGLKDRYDAANRQYYPGKENRNMYFCWDVNHVRMHDPNFQPFLLEVPGYVAPHLNDAQKQVLHELNVVVPPS